MLVSSYDGDDAADYGGETGGRCAAVGRLHAEDYAGSKRGRSRFLCEEARRRGDLGNW